MLDTSSASPEPDPDEPQDLRNSLARQHTMSVHEQPHLNDVSIELDMSTGKQSRRRSPLLVPQFSRILHVHATVVRDLLHGDSGRLALPTGEKARLLNSIPEMNRAIELNEMVQVGVFWDEVEYVRQLGMTESPFRMHKSVSDKEAEIVVDMLRLGPEHYKRIMVENLAKVEKLVHDLSSKEASLRKDMHNDVSRIMGSKNIVALEELSRRAGVHDGVLIEHLISGFPLTGCIGPTGRWKEEHRSAAVSKEAHDKMAEGLRRHVLARCKLGDDTDANTMLKKVTQEEVQRGYLDGPYTPEEAVLQEPSVTFARRFMLKQRDKWRPIDDFSISLTNSCVETMEKARVDTVDAYLARARFMSAAAKAAARGEAILMPDGSSRLIKLDKGWDVESLHLVGRCLDLSNAYKQYALDPRRKRDCAIAVASESGPEIYFSRVLPFGATASVYWFLRISDTLKHIFLDMNLIMTAYFDDFPGITFEGLADISHFSAEKILQLLGIEFSTKVNKRMHFAKSFSLLGVTVKFMEVAGDYIIVDNTEDRKIEVDNIVQEVLEKKQCNKALAAVLFGKLGFMSSQTWSRVGPLLTWAIRKRAQDPDGEHLDEELRSSLLCALALVRAPPREVVISSNRRVRWCLTDAAAEPDGTGGYKVTIGGVLLAFSGAVWRHFCEEVPQEIVRRWVSSNQPIAYAESLAALVAKVIWHGWMSGCDCVIAVDNIAAQQTLIRFNSKSPLLREVLRGHLVVDTRYSIRSWITWVASESNIADAPSRLDDARVVGLGSVRDRVSSPAWNAILAWLALSEVAVAKLFALR